MDLQSRLEAKRKIATWCLAVGLTLMGALLIGLWTVSQQADGQAHARDALSVGAVIAVFVLLYGAQTFYDSLGPKNEVVPPPTPLTLEKDQPWRPRTSMRYLEKLKTELVNLEKNVENSHQSAVRNYEQLSRADGRIAYNSLRSELQWSEASKKDALEQLRPLRERIEKVFVGDIGTEMLAIKEQIKKRQRTNQEHQQEITERQAKADRCTNPAPCQPCNEWAERKQSLRSWIHQNDHRIIELETDFEELQNFDFRKLWKELDLPGPPDLSRMPKDRIDDMKGKVDALNSIPSFKDRATQPSAEDARQKNKAKWETKIAELKTERTRKVAVADTEAERRRYENFFDDEIRQAEDQWRKYL